MIVVDNSVLVAALVDRGPVGKACASRISGERLAAPALIDIEATSAVRGLLLGRKIEFADADRALRLLPSLPIQRAQHTELLPRIWELRGNFTAYDAAYVALAEHLGVPLVTGDAKLQRGSGARCVIEVIN
ncbi:type II toxin-antitoxin system VapC family toxin [Streptomyces kaniharaensis]|uniref:Ribonuclease VapC n=1 Tax=Streptomyces kaniharaensis TaxID=212423 RepID=A0A6N7KNM7_9ACTN|nr:type II toxin-antitoxin system VapC family toxin [Streptomyces kaniharaensis]MQS13011.1 type II toxin-antitoxin system VapC family toxin [Streptomyces kaniharaensis]